MSFARVISRGAFLKARLGVNGIQNASRSLGRASAERRASERDMRGLRAGAGRIIGQATLARHYHADWLAAWIWLRVRDMAGVRGGYSPRKIWGGRSFLFGP